MTRVTPLHRLAAQAAGNLLPSSMPDQTPTRLSERLVDCEESLDSLQGDLSELSLFAEQMARADGGQKDSQAVRAMLLSTKSHVYRAWRLLRDLNAAMAGLRGFGNLVVDPVDIPAEACCPAWGLTAAFWSWSRSSDAPTLLVQPSVMGFDGLSLPVVTCPFCSARAPQSLPVEALGDSAHAVRLGATARLTAISSVLSVGFGEIVDLDDEDGETDAVPDA